MENIFTIHIDYTKHIEYIYDKIIANSLNEKDKQQLKIVLQRYNNRLQKYKYIIDKAPQKRSPEEYNNKVIEDIITRSRGRPKQKLYIIIYRNT